MADAAPDAGFVERPVGTHTSRTIMLDELRRLFAVCPPCATPADYSTAVVVDNVLLKPTYDTRRTTFRYLRDRYGLDREVVLFRALRDLWDADEAAPPLLAMLAACARDPLLRATASPVLAAVPGTVIEPSDLAASIADTFSDRFNDNTLFTTAQRAAASWRQSGHLIGTRHKRRTRAVCRPVAVAYALLLGHLSGARGDGLFATLWARVLDVPPHLARAQAAEVSRAGWIEYREAGGVTEVGFRYLLGERNGSV